MTPESAPERANAVGPTPVQPGSPEARQRAIFVAILHEGGFEWGDMIKLDDSTIARLLGGMAGLGYAIRPLVNRW